MTQFKYKLLKVYGVLGTRTRGGRMEDADESTELCRYPINKISLNLMLQRSLKSPPIWPHWVASVVSSGCFPV